jgi:hypothetical protein
LFPLFATNVVDSGGKFIVGAVKLPPTLLTLTANLLSTSLAKFAKVGTQMFFF